MKQGIPRAVSFVKNNSAVVLFALIWGIVVVLDKASVLYLYAWCLSLSHFRIWQPISFIFTCDSYFSLLYNVLALLLVGRPLEQSIGSRKFYTVIFCSAIICSMIYLGYSYGEFLYQSEKYPEISRNDIMKQIPVLLGSGLVASTSMIACAFIFPDLRLSIKTPKLSMKISHFVILWTGIGLLSASETQYAGGEWATIFASVLTSYVLIRYWKKSGRIYLRNKWF